LTVIAGIEEVWNITCR